LRRGNANPRDSRLAAQPVNYDALARLYRLQYANYRDDIGFYARLAEKLGASRVLEIGAGTGRVSIPLARRGLEVTALEPSEKMLEIAREDASLEGVQIDWVQGDARHFSLETRFPLVIAPFNMLMHLYTIGDQDDALERIKAHLEPGGVFAFDLYQPNFGLEGVLRFEDETFALPDGSRMDVFLHQRIDRTAQIALTTYHCDTVTADGGVKREILELRQRYYTRFELERWLSDFRVEWSGDFDGSRLSDASSSLIGVARLALNSKA
jgi:SAM-dependent methyltransferase